MCVRKSGLSPWIKSIGILKLFFRSYYESFPFRKCNKIENRTHGASSNIEAFTLSVPICCIVVPGPFPLQPYYSRGKNIKFYSTSHVNTFLMMTNAREEHCHSQKASWIKKTNVFQIWSNLSFFSNFLKKVMIFFYFFFSTFFE